METLYSLSILERRNENEPKSAHKQIMEEWTMISVHVLASGSDGNCIVIENEDESLMIDAGLSGRALTELMCKCSIDPKTLKGILISHEHVDHIRGAGVLSRRFNVPVFGNLATLQASPLGLIDSCLFNGVQPFKCGSFSVCAIPTSHDAVDPVTFSISHDDKKILVATDTGKITPLLEQELSKVDLAVIESNYDRKMLENGPYPIYLKRRIDSEFGHLSNVDCGLALKQTMGNGRKVFLAHLSRNNNDPDTARDTVARIMGIKRMNIDCLEFPGDYRTLIV